MVTFAMIFIEEHTYLIVLTGDFGVAAQLTRTMSKRNTVIFSFLVKFLCWHSDFNCYEA